MESDKLDISVSNDKYVVEYFLSLANFFFCGTSSRFWRSFPPIFGQ